MRLPLPSLLVALLVALSSPAAALPPGGDDFAGSQLLESLEGEVSATNVGATSEPGEPDHDGQAARNSIWFRWSPPDSGVATLYTLGSNFDTVLAVYEGDSLDTLSALGSNDDTPDSQQSLVELEVTAGQTLHVAVDGFSGATGRVQLLWHLDPEGAPPPPGDAFASRVPLETSLGQTVLSARRASREEGEPDHGFPASVTSLWWRASLAGDGILVLSSTSSSFESALVVYTGSTLETLVEVPGLEGPGTSPGQRSIAVESGRDYAVALLDRTGEAGLAVLDWQFLPGCEPPASPGGPTPPDGGEAIDDAIELTWGPELAPVARVIYGEDHRQDLYEIEDPDLIRLARSTVAVVWARNLLDLGDVYELDSRPFHVASNLCEDEPYRDQPVAAWCTAFLVGPGLVATAGHCLRNESECSEVAFVFGYHMLDENTPRLRIPREDVYFCSGIVDRLDEGDVDWALLRLDREVPDRVPMTLRREGELREGQELFVPGHPRGLPLKVAGGAQVRSTAPVGSFVANLDTYSGNSGSPVINLDTLEVEGILVSGEDDFIYREEPDCFVSNRCPDDGCLGESATEVREFLHLVPEHGGVLEYDLYLGACEEELTLRGTTTETSFTVSGLPAGSRHCWQVVARNGCEEVVGPIWSFTSRPPAESDFRRGEVALDGTVDLTDAIQILGHLFLGNALSIDCEDALDVDDSGAVDVTDPIALLSYQFLGATTPAPPFQACGEDPTGDALDCRSHPGCP